MALTNKRGREGLKFPGLGDRLRTAVGPVRPFMAAHPRLALYREGYFYEWFKERVPSYETLCALADDTTIPLSYLLLGKRAVDDATRLLDMAPSLLRAADEETRARTHADRPADDPARALIAQTRSTPFGGPRRPLRPVRAPKRRRGAAS